MSENNPLPREDVTDTSDELPARQRHIWMWYLVVIVAAAMIFVGILWIAELFGLFVAVFPNGAGVFASAIWAALGIAGFVLLMIAVAAMRR